MSEDEDEMLNESVERDARTYVCFTGPFGQYFGEVSLTDEELAEYNRHPDKYAAKHFGLSVEEYREWVNLNAHALCGARTKKGTLCSHHLGWFWSDPQGWRKTHRLYHCRAHGGVKGEHEFKL